MINKTLDLPFDEPQETYSTSEHLYHDQGIPPGTKGRIVDPAPVERAPRERSDRDRGGDRGGRSGGDRGGRSGGDRPAGNRDRNRTRSRSGAPVAEGSEGAGPAAETSGDKPAGSANRNRRRRRRSSGGDGQTPPAAESA